jgi:hypothetical protein
VCCAVVAAALSLFERERREREQRERRAVVAAALSLFLSPTSLALSLSMLLYCITRYSYICAAVIQTGRKFNECACALHHTHRHS